MVFFHRIGLGGFGLKACIIFCNITENIGTWGMQGLSVWVFALLVGGRV